MTGQYVARILGHAWGFSLVNHSMVHHQREPRARGKPAVPDTLEAAARLVVERERLLDAAVRYIGRQDDRIDDLLKVAKRCCKCGRVLTRIEVEGPERCALCADDVVHAIDCDLDHDCTCGVG